MILYVETNFLLELAYTQSDAKFCEDILTLARQNKIELVVPAFSITECFEQNVRQSKDKQKVFQELSCVFKNLERSATYQHLKEARESVCKALTESIEHQAQQLKKTIAECLEISTLISVDDAIIKEALDCTFNLSPQDAIVYCSVFSDLQKRGNQKKCFVTKNSKDFSNPDIEDALVGCDCKLLFSFQNGFQYVSNAKE